MESTSTTQNDESRIYKLSADYKKATYQTEQWNNVLKNDKSVRFEVTTYFRWGDFEIELNEKEKEEILKLDSIILNDYGCSCIELDDGCDRYEEIIDEDKFDEDEKKEIHRLLYYNEENDEDYESDADYCIDQDTLEINGWSMDDTIYGITTGCVLEDITCD